MFQDEAARSGNLGTLICFVKSIPKHIRTLCVDPSVQNIKGNMYVQYSTPSVNHQDRKGLFNLASTFLEHDSQEWTLFSHFDQS
jgi:hypothetical protein